jgi:hypothetical protein
MGVGDAAISPQLQAFIAAHIDSVMALEVLLLLAGDPAGDPPRRWNHQALAQELRIDPAWTAAQLRTFAAKGLLSGGEADGAPFWYDPAGPEPRQAVSDLARAYADRRVTVIGLIFARPAEAPAEPPAGQAAAAPADKLRSFADAFRIRKDNPDG